MVTPEEKILLAKIRIGKREERSMGIGGIERTSKMRNKFLLSIFVIIFTICLLPGQPLGYCYFSDPEKRTELLEESPEFSVTLLFTGKGDLAISYLMDQLIIRASDVMPAEWGQAERKLLTGKTVNFRWKLFRVKGELIYRLYLNSENTDVQRLLDYLFR